MTTDDAPLAPLPPGWDLRDEHGAPLPPLAAADRAHAGAATHGCDEFRDLWAHVPGAAELTVGDLPLPCTPDGWWRLRFENRAGLATLRARDATGREVAPPVTLYVRTAKLASVADHVAFLDRLLDDLFARATRLPFAAAASTAQPAREHHRPADALLAYHVLCAEAVALQTALRLIAVAPHRRLASAQELADLPRVRRLDTAGLLAVARAPELAALHGRADRAILAARPPSAIPHRRSEETRDTPENRFVAHAMREIRERLRALPRQAWWGSVPAAPRRTLAALDEALAANLREPWLRALPPMTRLPGASRVLQRREGYRDLARIWSALHQACRPLFDHLAQAIATLDVASVYELWVFFRVADDLGRWAGVTPVLDLRPAASEGLRYGAQATIGTAGTLVYNAAELPSRLPRTGRRAVRLLRDLWTDGFASYG